MSSVSIARAGVAGRPAGQDPDGRARRAALEDLEHYDEPSPEDAAELDELVWRHIGALLVGFEDVECPDGEPDDDDDDDDDRPGDGDRGDGPDRPAEVAPVPAPKAEPTPAAGPLAGALDQLALPFAEGAGRLGLRGGNRRDRTRPGDAPGWKGAANG